MSLQKKLNEKEKGKIEQLLALGYSQRKIASKLERSRAVVQNYIKNPANYGTSHSNGRPKLIKEKTRKKIIEFSTNKSVSCRNIINYFHLPVSRQTVLRVLKDFGSLKYTKMVGKPPLTKEHKNTRFEFALQHVSWSDEWKNIIFSDEKKFNLDGPDGYKYYWHDLNSSKISYSKTVQGGGGIMIW